MFYGVIEKCPQIRQFQVDRSLLISFGLSSTHVVFNITYRQFVGIDPAQLLHQRRRLAPLSI